VLSAFRSFFFPRPDPDGFYFTVWSSLSPVQSPLPVRLAALRITRPGCFCPSEDAGRRLRQVLRINFSYPLLNRNRLRSFFSVSKLGTTRYLARCEFPLMHQLSLLGYFPIWNGFPLARMLGSLRRALPFERLNVFYGAVPHFLLTFVLDLLFALRPVRLTPFFLGRLSLFFFTQFFSISRVVDRSRTAREARPLSPREPFYFLSGHLDFLRLTQGFFTSFLRAFFKSPAYMLGTRFPPSA